VWLEKVKFQTRRAVGLEEIAGTDTALTGLLHSIQRLQLDGDTLSALVPELANLRSKLPPEIHNGEEPFLAPTPETIAELRTAVQDLLIAKLLQHGRVR